MMAAHTGNLGSVHILLSIFYHTRIDIFPSPVHRVKHRSFCTHIHRLHIHHTRNLFYTTSRGWDYTCTYIHYFQNSVCLDSRMVDRHTSVILNPICKGVHILFYTHRSCSHSIVLYHMFLCYDRGIYMMYR